METANSVKAMNATQMRQWLESKGVSTASMNSKNKLNAAVNSWFIGAPAGRNVRVVFFGDSHESQLCSLGIGKGITDLLTGAPISSFLAVSEGNDIHACLKYAGFPPERILTEFPLRTPIFIQPEFFTVAFIEYSKLFSSPNPKYIQAYWELLFRDLIRFIDVNINGNPNHPLLKAFVQLIQIISKKPPVPKMVLDTAFHLFAEQVEKLPSIQGDARAHEMWKKAADSSIGMNLPFTPEWNAYTMAHAGRRDIELLQKVKARVLAEPLLKTIAIVFGDSHLSNQMALFEADPLFNVDRAASKSHQESTKMILELAASSQKKGGRKRRQTRRRRT